MGYKKSKRQLYTQTRIPLMHGPRTISPQQFVKGVSRTKQVVRKQTQSQGGQVPGLFRDAQGYYAKFKSKSDPTKPPYTTRIWTAPTSRFKIGDVSCDCPGWIYNHKCHHINDIVEMARKDPNVPHIPLNV
jgi:hypothetical protein